MKHSIDKRLYLKSIRNRHNFLLSHKFQLRQIPRREWLTIHLRDPGKALSEKI